jgi:hypothetical protein
MSCLSGILHWISQLDYTTALIRRFSQHNTNKRRRLLTTFCVYSSSTTNHIKTCPGCLLTAVQKAPTENTQLQQSHHLTAALIASITTGKHVAMMLQLADDVCIMHHTHAPLSG